MAALLLGIARSLLGEVVGLDSLSALMCRACVMQDVPMGVLNTTYLFRSISEVMILGPAAPELW